MQNPSLSSQDAARDRPLNLLFQVIKRSKTRGDVKMTLRVGPTSLDRVNGERLQHRVSSLPLLSVEKVYLFTDDATQVCLNVSTATYKSDAKQMPASYLFPRLFRRVQVVD